MDRRTLTAWTYARGPARWYRPAYVHIARAVDVTRGAVLDVGCGPGDLCAVLAAGHPELDAVGIDTSPAMIRHASTRRDMPLNASFRLMDARHIAFPEHTFDAAVSVQSAHHWQEPDRIFSEVHRVLRPGARFYVYEADAGIEEVPPEWIARRRGWPPNALLRRQWRRYGMDQARWDGLRDAVSASPFGGGEDGRHGFYRRLVLTRR